LWPILSLVTLVGLLTLSLGLLTNRLEAGELSTAFDRIALGIVPDAASQTISVRIATSTDDAEEWLADGYMYRDSSDLELGNDPGTLGDQTVGMRFQNIQIPPNATIQEAYIEFQVDRTDSVATSVIFTAQAADNPATFSSTAHDLTSRPRTQTQVTWSNIPAWSQSGVKQRSPDLSSILQEVVNRAGWLAGGSVVVIVEGSGTRTAESYDGDASAAPLLVVQFGDSALSPTPTATETPAGTQETWVRVGRSSDDVEERLSDGYMYRTSSDLELGNDPGTLGDQTVGMRFQSLPIPPNATIQEAFVEFQVDRTDSAATSVIFSAQAADNPATFSSTAHDLTSRPRTQAQVAWSNIPAWNQSGVKQRSPDLSSILQEVVNRAGWQAGGSVVVIVEGSGTRTADSYDGNPDGAPLLYVRFGPDDSTSPTPTGTPTQTVTGTPPTPQTPTSTATSTATATATATKPSLRVGVLGDFGSNSAAQSDVAAMLQAQNLDLLVTVGDNRYSTNSFDAVIGQYYCDFLAGVSGGNYCPRGNRGVNGFFPALGNHDYTDGAGIDQYLAYFDLPGAGVGSSGTSGNERYYDVIQGPVHFFFLDSQAARNSATEMAAQRAWLQAQVAASSATWQVVLMHHPPYTSPSSHSSNSELQWPFQTWGVDAVLAGHNHFYERIFREGIVYFVNGLGGRSIYSIDGVIAGSQVRYNGDYGAMVVDADAHTLRFRFLTRTGALIDDYSLTQSDPTTPTVTPTPTATPTATTAPSATPTASGTPATPGVVTVSIRQADDDAEERLSNGAMNLRSSDLEMVTDASLQAVGLRFNDLLIPQGATISAAYIEFVTDETNNEATVLRIQAEATDHAAPFASNNQNISARSLGSSATEWTPPAWNSVGESQRTPDISPLIQAVVGRAGWREGNSIALIINGTGKRVANAYDGDPSAAARLVVHFSAAPTTSGGDLIADKLEVTQGVQDLRNSVSLVTNKRTFVRFHARTDQGVAQAAAQLIAQRGSERVVLLPVNGQSSRINVRSNPDRQRIDDAFLFELPNGFREGAVTLTGELNPQNVPAESERGNNTTTVTVSFQPVPPLYLVLYNVSYSYRGHTNQVSDFHLDRIESWLRQAYPANEIQVVRRSLYAGSGVPSCNSSDLLGDLRAIRLRDLNNPAIPNYAVYYGVVYDGGPDNQFMRGRGGGFVGCGPTGAPQGSWGWDTDGSFGDWYAGHEIGHTYGRPHSPCDVSGDANFPNPGGLISPTQSGERAIYGFNAETREIYLANWADVMSYCPKQWTSDYTYQKLLETFQSYGSGLAARRLDDRQDRLQVSGLIAPTGEEAVLNPLFVLSDVADVIERVPGDYTILLRDDEGQELARYPFTPRSDHLGPPPPGATDFGPQPDSLTIGELVPYVAGTARVEILGSNGAVIGIRQSGVTTPSVSILAPAPNATLNGEAVDVVWSAADPDGDALTYAVLYSADGGANWRMVAPRVVADSLPVTVTIPRGNLQQSSNARFRVQASDGIHTGVGETEGSLVLANLPPTVQIETPADGLTVYAGQTVTLVGSGYDGDEGTLLDSQLSWRSDIDGLLGSGAVLSTASLGLGKHTIRLQGEDTNGATASAEIGVTVAVFPSAPGQIYLPMLNN